MIGNEGQLPQDWTVERLKTKHPSRPFNPDIANCFFRAGLIEAWGRGTIKILQECRLAKVSLPVFKYDLSGFVIEFGYVGLHKPAAAVIDLARTTTGKILHFIIENKSVTKVELSEKAGVSLSTIDRVIRQLQKGNLISRVGSDKAGWWEVHTDDVVK